MNLGVRGGAGGEARLFDAMDVIERHRLAGSVKDRGLVHVIPEAGNAILNELFVEAAPPVARLGAGEVRKDRRAGPDDADKLAAIRFLHEVVARLAGVVRGIALVRAWAMCRSVIRTRWKCCLRRSETSPGKLGKVCGLTVKGRFLSW